jgi:hypothetical protein
MEKGKSGRFSGRRKCSLKSVFLVGSYHMIAYLQERINGREPSKL